MRWKKTCCGLLAALLLALGACAPAPPARTAALEADLTYLCTEGEGRLTGTAGNERVTAYLAAQFEAAGLEPLAGAQDMLLPYDQEVFDPAEQGQVLTATYADGSVKTFRAGEDSGRAILLTAHFDHVGGYGGVVFPGALDNAAGTAALLELARLLGPEEALPCDVVFVAFNGEDNGLKGSEAFVEAGLPYGAVNVINFDTVGWSDSPVVGVSDTHEALARALEAALDGAGLTAQTGAYGNSDHMSFIVRGIPAVNLGAPERGETLNINEVIHTVRDTPGQVDLERVAAVAAAVADYVRQGILAEPEAAEDETDEEALWEQAEARGLALVEELALARDEAVWFRLGEYTLEAVGQNYIERPGARAVQLLRQFPSGETPPLETPVPRQSLGEMVQAYNVATEAHYRREDGRYLILSLRPAEEYERPDWYVYEAADRAAGLWNAYTNPEVYSYGKLPAELLVQQEGMPCALALKFIRWDDQGRRLNDDQAQADLDELAALAADHLEELRRIEPILW